MINTTLSKRYAQALVEIGQEADALDKYGQDIEAMNQLMDTSKPFRDVLINPVFPKDGNPGRRIRYVFYADVYSHKWFTSGFVN